MKIYFLSYLTNTDFTFNQLNFITYNNPFIIDHIYIHILLLIIISIYLNIFNSQLLYHYVNVLIILLNHHNIVMLFLTYFLIIILRD